MLDLGAKVDALTNITTEMFPALLKAMDIKITLDDGTLVGRLAPEALRNNARSDKAHLEAGVHKGHLRVLKGALRGPGHER